MRTIGSLALISLLPACASFQYDPDPYDRAAPFEAWLLPSGDRLGFTLSEPAHVAVFEIVSGSGVSLLYPSYGYQERLLDAGMHHPFVGQVRGRWYYDDVGYRYSSYRAQPRILYLLACRAPMEVTHLRLSPGLIRSSLGFRYYESLDPWTTIDVLTSLAVPSAADQENCVGDVYYDYPDAGLWNASASHDTPYYTVRCPNGRIYSVPYYASSARVCGSDTRGTTTPRQPDTGAVTPRQPDTTGVIPRMPPRHPGLRGDSTLVDAPERPRVRRMWEEEARPRTAEDRLRASDRVGDELREGRRRDVDRPTAEPRSSDERPRAAPTGDRRAAEPRATSGQRERRASEPRPREERAVEPKRSEPPRSKPRPAEPRPRAEPREETKRERQPDPAS